MGFNYFTAVDPDKNPLDPKIHITYTGKNLSGNNSYLSDYQDMLANGTSAIELEQSMWEHFKDIYAVIAFNHFVSVLTCLNLFWFSMLWISLTTRQLLWFYLYIGTLACLPTSYLVNKFTIDAIRSGTVAIQNSEPGLVWIHNFIRKFSNLLKIFSTTQIFREINWIFFLSFSFSQREFGPSLICQLHHPSSLWKYH